MIDPNSQGQCLALTWLCIFALAEQLHPASAMGTSFGCFCFLAFADPTVGKWYEKLLRKIALLIFSWGAGYAAGSAIAASTDPDVAKYAMIVAVVAAAVSATLLGAVNLMIRNDGPLPKWLGAIVDRIPVLRKGNDET